MCQAWELGLSETGAKLQGTILAWGMTILCKAACAASPLIHCSTSRPGHRHVLSFWPASVWHCQQNDQKDRGALEHVLLLLHTLHLIPDAAELPCLPHDENSQHWPSVLLQHCHGC